VPEEAFGVALELAQNQSRDFRWSKSLLAQLLFAKSDAQHFTGLQVLRQTEREELQFLLNILNSASHQALN